MGFKTYNEFVGVSLKTLGSINEGIFDKMFAWMKNIAAMFKDPVKMQKTVQAVITEAGDSGAKNLIPSSIGEKETYFVMLGEEEGKQFSISLTKMADMPDNTGLFQITGTTSEDMLKALTGGNKIEDLTKQNVMAIVSDKSIIKGSPMTIIIFKNMMKDKDYVSVNKISGIAQGMAVEKVFNNQ